MDASRPGAGTALQVRVGVFVRASLLVFAGLVYMLGRSAGLFERQYRLVAGFSQIGGLIQGATVRLAGVPLATQASSSSGAPSGSSRRNTILRCIGYCWSWSASAWPRVGRLSVQ